MNRADPKVYLLLSPPIRGRHPTHKYISNRKQWHPSSCVDKCLHEVMCMIFHIEKSKLPPNITLYMTIHTHSSIFSLQEEIYMIFRV
jgi:hypothetical protein